MYLLTLCEENYKQSRKEKSQIKKIRFNTNYLEKYLELFKKFQIEFNFTVERHKKLNTGVSKIKILPYDRFET